MGNIFSTVQAYLNFALKLRHFLHTPVTLDDIKKQILQQTTNRDENFIKILKTNVFEYPHSPYLALFKASGITHTDVEKMVIQQGIESTLEELYDADIYVTFEEFKGRIPIKRKNIELNVTAGDFDNPNLSSVFWGQSGGSTGKATRSKMDLDHIVESARLYALSYSVQDIFDAPLMMWRGTLPDHMGMGTALRSAYIAQPTQRWFSTFRDTETNLSSYYTLMTYLMIYLARFYGYHIPSPEYVPLDNPLPIAKALAEGVQKMGTVLMNSTVSKCVRVAIVAKEHGIDLTGVVFYGTSEPSTVAKVASIEASGAKYITHYGTSETGVMGLACANPVDTTDVHFMHNKMAIIQRPKEIFDQTVNAFHLTTLLPSSPKMALNVQSDDFGIIEERDCGCPLHQMGFTKHIRGISSYRKLTGEGVTLVGSDMVHILEHILPAQFGGSLLDYQLVEEENEQGLTKLYLYVDPAVSVQSDDMLSQAFLSAMKESVPSARLAQAEYRTGHVVTVKRQKPLQSSRGKYFPIRTLNMKP